VAARRRYHVPILVGLTVDGEHQKDVATLVLDRAGLRRLDRTSDETTATSTEMTRPP
jgi:hypothetical protein